MRDGGERRSERGFAVFRVKNVLNVNVARFFISSRLLSSYTYIPFLRPFLSLNATARKNMMKFLQYFYHIINSKQVQSMCVVGSSRNEMRKNH